VLADAQARASDEILFEALPPRRLRANPRVVKRKMSKFRVKRPEHRLWPQPVRSAQDAVVILAT
jgi:hypothetical protein